MTYSRTKRAATFFLALVMLFTLMPNVTPTANAATTSSLSGLTDNNIELSHTYDSGTVNAGSVTCDVTANSINVTVKSARTSAAYTTITMKNVSGSKAQLSFYYTVDKLENGSVKINNSVEITSANSTRQYYSVELENNASATVYVNASPNWGQKTTTTAISDIKLTIIREVNVTFNPATSGGTYKVNNTTINTETTITHESTAPYELVATASEGYHFEGWYDESGNCVSRRAEDSYTTDKNCTLTPRFCKASTATFLVNKSSYETNDLNDAIANAQDNGGSQITLISDGTIYGSYTIPSGITLLIPYDNTYTAMGATPGCTDANYTNPSKYMKLTMANGAKLTVEGTLEVGAKHSAKAIGKNQPGGGSVSGGYGQINMLGSSNITVSNGGSLFCWGYITGSGSVNVLSGATVYEYLQIRDFRGGNASLGFVQDGSTSLMRKGFFFCQYYVQNIEAPLTISYGATEYVYNSIYIDSFSTAISNLVEFIGTDGLFALESGSLTKTYVPSSDRLRIDVDGNLKLNKIEMTLRLDDGLIGKLTKVEVNSADFILPITNNIDVNIKSGNTTIANEMNFLPGSSVTVDKNATLTIESGKRAFFYDKNQWESNYAYDAYIIPVKYSPTRSDANIRTWDMTNDAELVVNGRVNVSGSLYVTEGGANICSAFEGYDGINGAIYFGANQSGNSTTYQVANTDLKEITAKPAILQNADGSTTDTNGALSCNTFYYYDGKWVNGKMVTITYKNPKNGGTLGTEQVMAEWSTPKYNAKLNTTRDTSFVDANNRAWTRTGWTTNDTGVPSEGENYTANSISIIKDANNNFPNTITLYAVWVRDSYNLSFVAGNGGSIVADAKLTVKANATVDEVKEEIQKNPNLYYTCNEGYEFDSITLEDGYTKVTNDITVTVNFKLKSYSVTVDGKNKGSVEHGSEWSGIDRVTYNSDNTFAIVTDVSGANATLNTENDKYEVSNVTNDLTLTTTKITGTLLIVRKEQFVACPKGENLIVLVTTKLADGEVYTLGDEAFYWSEQYKAYVMFADENLEAKEILSRLKTGTGTVTYVYDKVGAENGVLLGDVSGNGQVTSLDAGIINDILNGYDSPAITDLMRLRMDVVSTPTGTDQPKVYDWYIGVCTQDIVKILNIAVGN